MPFPRASGILLHPTSLPGKDGIGDLGPEAFKFVDFLAYSGQQLWQILPLTHTYLGNSPYTAYSSFAGNPLLISLEPLVEAGLLTTDDVRGGTVRASTQVDYDRVRRRKLPLLRTAFDRFSGGRRTERHERDFRDFCRSESGWLDDYALFMALSAVFEGASWTSWPPAMRLRERHAIDEQAHALEGEVSYHKFVQFQFFQQWRRLRKYANEHGVQIIGDVPFYPAQNSADVWTNRRYFRLDAASGEPLEVAGVPPDYFSEQGQLWGNPIFDWPALKRAGFDWWIERIRGTLAQVDIVRIDHFRGFESYWSIPADATSAVDGRWVKAPGQAFFETLRRSLGPVPVIAEDLGSIGPEVTELRRHFGIPGMKVLQFAFGTDAQNAYLPHNLSRDSVVYTGTHDNNTTLGWYREDATAAEKDALHRYLGCDDPNGVGWALIRVAMASVANQAVIPLQDILGLGSEARMNTPGTTQANWSWRYGRRALTQKHGDRLLELSTVYGRLGAR